MTRRAIAVAGGAGALLLAGAWLLGGDGLPPAGAAGPVGGPRAARAPVVAPVDLDPHRPALPPPPDSLAGTDPDGALPVDAAGRLIVTRDVLDLFEYWLSASGEEPLTVTRARIEAEIARLPEPAMSQALDLLDRTLGYRTAMGELHAEGLGDADLERRLQRIREVRRAWFGEAERDAFFAAQEARWEVDLARHRVMRDPELSEAERAERLAALEERLPPAAREARAAALAPVRLREDEAALREAGAADAEIHALRERRFGPEAAERLRALDERRAQFETRLAAWRARAAALRAEGADADEIDAARARAFEAGELARVQALDRSLPEFAR